MELSTGKKVEELNALQKIELLYELSVELDALVPNVNAPVAHNVNRSLIGLPEEKKKEIVDLFIAARIEQNKKIVTDIKLDMKILVKSLSTEYGIS